MSIEHRKPRSFHPLLYRLGDWHDGYRGEIPDDILDDVKEAKEEIERLWEKLDTIAGGHIDRFPGGPDIMAVTPEEFRYQMWTWSQSVARDALPTKPKV